MSGYSAGSAEEAFGQSREAFARAQEWLAGPAAAGLDHAVVEEELAVRGREIQRLMFQDYLDAQAAAEPRLGQVAGPDGVVRRRAERGHSRQLASVFGPVVVSRIAYRAAGAANVHPLDERLGLPAGKHSDGLAKMTAAAAAAGSFEAACAQVRARTGCALGTRQAQQLARAAACDFDDFYAARRPPPAGPGQVLVLEVDGKGIAVRPGEGRSRARPLAVPKQDGRLSRGEVRTRKRMAEVAAVFDLTPVPRTAAGILGPGPRPPGPQAAGKWLTASITAAAADVVAAAFDEAGRRDPGCQRTWIALADGNKDQISWMQAQAAARGITLPVIIDFIHVLEYLWDAAWAFFPEASPHAGPWVRDHAAAILDGCALQVAAALRADADAAGLGKTKHATAGKTARYLEAKAPWLDYPAALANGWPISTGVIEGACRHLVKDRMAITGARWGVTTAEAILKLRALQANGDFDDYWTYHRHREHQRNHPASYQLAA